MLGNAKSFDLSSPNGIAVVHVVKVDVATFPCDSVVVSNHSTMHSDWATRIGVSLRCFDGADSSLFSVAYDG